MLPLPDPPPTVASSPVTFRRRRFGGANIARSPPMSLTHSARRHLGQRLAVREPDGGGLGLHDLPERVFGEVFDRLAGPVAVAALDQPVVDVPFRFALLRRGDGLGGLDAALERA